MTFSLALPGRVLSGEHISDTIPGAIPDSIRNILLVAGNHSSSNGDAERIQKILEESGRTVRILDGIPAEPPPEAVDRVAVAAREFHAQGIAALGGGSVIDTAKAGAALAACEGVCADYFHGEKKITGKGLFFAAIPTTAGTGAEMTSNAVLTDGETRIKKSLRSPFMTPDLAVCDPVFTWSLPPALTASCGMDAFIQAMESITSLRSNPFSESLAERAIVQIASALPRAFRDGGDRAARAAMAEGSMLTGLAFAQTGLGAIHGLAHPCGSLLHVPHGIACAILMGPVIRFNLKAVPGPYAKLAKLLGAGTHAEDFVRFIENLAQELGIPRGFGAWNPDMEKAVPFIVANCRGGSMKTNPCEMGDDAVKKLLSVVLSAC